MSEEVGTVVHDAETDTWAVSMARFDNRIKNEVKALGAKFDWSAKVWRFRADDGPRVFGALRALGFTTPDGEAIPDREQQAPKLSTAKSWTVRQINQRVRGLLEQTFRRPVWIVGEIDGFDRSRNRQHVYFELVERDVTDAPSARLTAVLFASARQRIEQVCARAGVKLTDGLRVRLRGKLDLYVPRGNYQIVIDDIDVAFTEGELALRRGRILRELRREGLLEKNRALPMPRVPLRVALVTSATSDARHDVIETLRQSGFGFDVTLYPVKVAGDELEYTVRAALRSIAAHRHRFDVCVITRGGGSRGELSGWDRVRLARDVANLPVKVIVAIGHQQDRSVLDELASSVKTPTAAGAMLVDACEQERALLTTLADQLRHTAERELQTERAVQRRRATELHNATRHRVAADWAALTHMPSRIAAATSRRTERERLRLSRTSDAVVQRTRVRMGGLSERLDASAEQLRGAVRRELSHAREHVETRTRDLHRATSAVQRDASRELAGLRAQVRLIDPRRVLERGFALLRGADGRVRRSIGDLAEGELLRAQLSDGEVEVTVGASVKPDEE